MIVRSSKSAHLHTIRLNCLSVLASVPNQGRLVVNNFIPKDMKINARQFMTFLERFHAKFILLLKCRESFLCPFPELQKSSPYIIR